MRRSSMSNFWQNITMTVVTLSFVSATVGYGPSKDFWVEGWEGIMAFLAVGVGMKMVQRSSDNYIDKKYGSPGRGIEGD